MMHSKKIKLLLFEILFYFELHLWRQLKLLNLLILYIHMYLIENKLNNVIIKLFSYFYKLKLNNYFKNTIIAII